MEKKEFLEVGKIINTHGVTGEMKVESWCDSPDVLKGIKRFHIGGEEFSPVSVRTGGAFPLIKLSGINTVEDAAKYKNKILTARRSEIKKPEGASFICDLIGLPVIDRDSGKIYGTLSDVLEYSPNPIYSIKTEKGEVLMPAVKEYVAKIDEDEGIFVTPIEGFFD